MGEDNNIPEQLENLGFRMAVVAEARPHSLAGQWRGDNCPMRRSF